MSNSETITDPGLSARINNDTHTQLEHLRRQIETLMNERVTPVLADAAHRAENVARQARDTTKAGVESLSGSVREQPIIAVLVATGVGYLLGRFFRG